MQWLWSRHGRGHFIKTYILGRDGSFLSYAMNLKSTLLLHRWTGFNMPKNYCSCARGKDARVMQCSVWRAQCSLPMKSFAHVLPAFCRSRTSILPSGLTVPNHALKCRLSTAPLPEKTKVWNLDGVGAERTLSGKRLHNEGRDAYGWVEMRAAMLTTGHILYGLYFNEDLLLRKVPRQTGFGSFKMEITRKYYMVNKDKKIFFFLKRSQLGFVSVNCTLGGRYPGCKNHPGEMIPGDRIVLKCEMIWKVVQKVSLISLRSSTLIRLYGPR